MKITTILLSLMLIITSCTPLQERESMMVLGTQCSIYIPGGAEKQVFIDIFTRLQEIHQKFSTRISDSEISKVNNNAGIKPVQVSPEVFEVIKEALYISELSDGAFDPSIGKLVDLWGIGTENANIPDVGKIKNLINYQDYSKIELLENNHLVYITDPQAAIDLGAIAKGYAGDEITRILNEYGINSAIIDLGGNIIAHGTKAPETPWKLGIQDPAQERNTVIATVELADKSLVTSGIYERFFIEDGVRYHHILNPETGYPVESELTSVTVISEDSSMADGLSTALFVLGIEKGLALVETLENIEALFITVDQRMIRSSSFPESFEPRN